VGALVLEVVEGERNLTLKSAGERERSHDKRLNSRIRKMLPRRMGYSATGLGKEPQALIRLTPMRSNPLLGIPHGCSSCASAAPSLICCR